VLQREEEIQVEKGRLRLTATQTDNHLTVQLNNQTVEFENIWTTAPAEQSGAFGLYWPAGLRLARVEAQSRLAADTSGNPLATGDLLYAKKKYAEALSFFQEQGRSAVNKPMRRQADCKAALCYVRLGQTKEAIPLFERLVKDDPSMDDQWSLLAAFQLWLYYLESKNYKEAENIFQIIRWRFPNKASFETIAASVPDEIRRRILAGYLGGGGREHLVLFSAKLLPVYESAAEVADMFHATSGVMQEVKVNLLFRYRLLGMEAKARSVAQGLIQTAETTKNYPYYMWLSQNYGNAPKALGILNSWIAAEQQSGDDRSLAWNLMSRSRLYAAVNRPGEAGKDLEHFFGLPWEKTSYSCYAEACLMQGFLYEDRGEHAKALEAWRKGLFRNWLLKVAPDQPNHPYPPEPLTLVVASLANDLTDDEAKQALDAFVSFVAGTSFARLMPRFSAASLRRICQARGPRALARQRAFGQTAGSHENARHLIRMLAAEKIRQDAFTGAPSPEQEALLWEAVEGVSDAYTAGRLSLGHLGTLQLTWERGSTGFLGWTTSQKNLDPKVRGQVAYLLGHRFLHLPGKTPKDAIPFFKQALQDAAHHPTLQRLAQAELDRLKSK